MIRSIHKNQQYKILLIMPITLIITAFFYQSPLDIINGLYTGIMSNNRLLSDSFQVMGVGAALFNAGLLGVISLLLIIYLDMKPNGLTMMVLQLMMGFGFLGKNPINIIPILIGGFINSRMREISFKAVVINSLLACAVSPVVSSVADIFNYQWYGMMVAVVVGIIIGMFLPSIAHKVLVAHEGYSLYNMGFAAGLLSIAFYSILKSLKIEFNINAYVNTGIHYGVVASLIFVYCCYILIGYFGNNKSFTGFHLIYRSTGILVSDFTRISGFYNALINQGILGLCCILICMMFKELNGAILSGIFSVVGFASFGKHLKNTIPIMIGVGIGSLFLNQISTTTLLMTMFLATTLAPIAGEFGFLIGIVTGILHILLVGNFTELHGGINLYNNGLSAGILAMIIVPCIQLFKGEDE